MQAQWQQKTETGNYTQKAGSGAGPEVDSVQRQLEQLRENKDVDLETIYAKLYSGKKLSSDELAYLREKNPEAYKKAKEIEAERKSFKENLKRCKTKDDFQRLKTLHLSVAMARVNGIANDPNIPKAKKMELLLQENAKTKAVEEEARKFVESGSYNRLPTDAERNEALKEKNEAGEPEDAKPDQIQEEDGTEEELVPEEEQEPAAEGAGIGGNPASDGAKPEQKPALKDADAVQKRTAGSAADSQVPVEDMTEAMPSFSREVYAKNAYKDIMSLTGKGTADIGTGTVKYKKA